MEWYWQGKMEVLGGKPVPVPPCPPKMPHEMAWHRTWNPAVRGPRLTQGTDPRNVQKVAAVSCAVQGRYRSSCGCWNESRVTMPLEISAECDTFKTILELDQITPKRRVGRCRAGAPLTKTS
jgi:hypothetical protein